MTYHDLSHMGLSTPFLPPRQSPRGPLDHADPCSPLQVALKRHAVHVTNGCLHRFDVDESCAIGVGGLECGATVCSRKPMETSNSR